MIEPLASTYGHGAAWWSALQASSEDARLLCLRLIIEYARRFPGFVFNAGEWGCCL